MQEYEVTIRKVNPGEKGFFKKIRRCVEVVLSLCFVLICLGCLYVNKVRIDADNITQAKQKQLQQLLEHQTLPDNGGYQARVECDQSQKILGISHVHYEDYFDEEVKKIIRCYYADYFRSSFMIAECGAVNKMKSYIVDIDQDNENEIVFDCDDKKCVIFNRVDTNFIQGFFKTKEEMAEYANLDADKIDDIWTDYDPSDNQIYFKWKYQHHSEINQKPMEYSFEKIHWETFNRMSVGKFDKFEHNVRYSGRGDL